LGNSSKIPIPLFASTYRAEFVISLSNRDENIVFLKSEEKQFSYAYFFLNVSSVIVSVFQTALFYPQEARYSIKLLKIVWWPLEASDSCNP
jgi:hypothetical protein